MAMLKFAPVVKNRLFLLIAVFVAGCASPGARHGSERDREVLFELHAPHAHNVTLLGDFNDWAPRGIPLAGPDSKGNWRLFMVVPGSGKRLGYGYLVDGSDYRTDDLRSTEQDDYGGRNNVVYLP